MITYRWNRIRPGFHECWHPDRLECRFASGRGWVACVRHGEPSIVGTFPTLREAKAAAEREYERQQALQYQREKWAQQMNWDME